MIPARKIVKFNNDVGFEHSRSTVGGVGTLIDIEVVPRCHQIAYGTEVVEITDGELLAHLEGVAQQFIEKCRFMGLVDMHISDLFYHVLSGGEVDDDQ